MNKVKDDFFLHSNKVGHISKEDYDKIELLVNAAKAFARSTYQCVYIIDYFHQDFIYASDNLAYLCGLEPEQLMEAGYQMYIDHVPDADLQMLLEVNKKGFDLFNELPMGDRLDYTISYDFHLTNGRHSRLIHHHLTPILLSDDGRVWLALCTVSLAATDEPGHIIMQKNGERSYFEYSTLRHKWEKKEGITLSETERDVLRLSAQGYTMNDIADRLCKSVDTDKGLQAQPFRQAWREEHCRSAVSCHELSDAIIAIISLPTMARDRTSGSISPPCLPQGSRECWHNSRRLCMPRCPVTEKTHWNNA